jgi:hypothetical protein
MLLFEGFEAACQSSLLAGFVLTHSGAAGDGLRFRAPNDNPG